MVREGCTIGRGSLVGIGAVVLDDVPAHEVWAGSPARHLRAAGKAAVEPSEGVEAMEVNR
jgi:acetyltransferase-like isoleucine patch superfamily enzyme